MKLKDLAAKPKLIEIKLEDEETVAKYGEPVSFWIHDRQPIDIFARMSGLGDGNFAQIADLMKDMILNEDGSKISGDGELLPTDLQVKATNKVVEELGKLVNTASAQKIQK